MSEPTETNKEFFETIKITDIRGLGGKVQEQLNSIDIFSIVDLARADPHLMSGLKGISKENAITFILAAQALLRDRDALTKEFCTALDVMEKRKKVIRITTGSSDLDKLLYGGI